MSVYLAHLIGDYLLQTDRMAIGKKKSSWICLVHVLTYLIPFIFTPLVWWKLALIGLQHFLQDRWNFVPWFMCVKGSGQFTLPPCGPWSVIVTDNILHILFIAWIASI
jgi:hypothetical protein